MSAYSPLTYGKSCTVPAVAGEPALLLTDVAYTYPGASEQALAGVSLAVQPGERLALVGPNGAGKSTLIKAIAGLIEPERGHIEVYGNEAGACRHRVALVPQRTEIDWKFPVTVYEVVMMGRYAHLGWFKRPGAFDHDQVAAALDRMNIGDLAGRQVGELSGGQQQRVMLARTLAHDADLLLLDEPLNHVDIATQELIFHVLETLAAEGCTVIVSTHDLGLLPIHFSRAAFIDQTVIADGPVADVLTANTIARAYGIRLCSDDTGQPNPSPFLNKTHG